MLAQLPYLIVWINYVKSIEFVISLFYLYFNFSKVK